MGGSRANLELFSEEQKTMNSNLFPSSLAHFGHPKGKKQNKNKKKDKKKKPSVVLWQNSY